MDPIYLTDEIDIITVITDANGVITTSTQSGVRARVAEKNRLILDRNGKEVVGSIQIILNSISVAYESKIKIKKIAGAAYSRPTKEWQVKQVSKGHGFDSELTEVWV
jgi:hypothetical protein